MKVLAILALVLLPAGASGTADTFEDGSDPRCITCWDFE